MPKFSVYIEISNILKSMAISDQNLLLKFPDFPIQEVTKLVT